MPKDRFSTSQESFFIIDRKKELIKVRGWSVSATEIEAVLLHHPDVEDTAVVGTIESGGDREEFIKAYIAVKPDMQSTFDANNMQSWLRERLASYKIPEEIIIVTDIPRSTEHRGFPRHRCLSGLAGLRALLYFLLQEFLQRCCHAQESEIRARELCSACVLE